MGVLFFVTAAAAFLINVAILIAVARALQRGYKNRLIAILGTVLVGALLSVISDFTVAYAAEAYDRSLLAIIERAGMSSGFAAVIAFFASRNSNALPSAQSTRGSPLPENALDHSLD